MDIQNNSIQEAIYDKIVINNYCCPLKLQRA